jgi:hypothetical protein
MVASSFYLFLHATAFDQFPERMLPDKIVLFLDAFMEFDFVFFCCSTHARKKETKLDG